MTNVCSDENLLNDLHVEVSVTSHQWQLQWCPLNGIPTEIRVMSPEQYSPAGDLSCEVISPESYSPVDMDITDIILYRSHVQSLLSGLGR